MTIQTGDKLPDATFVKVTENGPEQVNTADYFKGRRVALFSVPGAFTPTCSAKHLPGFVDKADELKAKGVDRIVCMAVNDAFVMHAWGKSQHVPPGMKMLADGNADLTRALGLELDASGYGMGVRSKRFALYAEDGIVRGLWVEAPGEFRVSSAEYVLAHLPT